MFLREYVYVDIDKVRGLAGQLYEGVPQLATHVTNRRKQLQADFKLVGASWGKDQGDSVERSLGDALFNDVELDLESLGVLLDLSAELARDEDWTGLGESIQPGRVVRITAPGTLFHPTQMSESLVGLATAAHGLVDIGAADALSPTPIVPPKANQNGRKPAPRRSDTAGGATLPEDALPLGDEIPVMGVKRDLFAGLIKIIRGTFGEGLHLQLRPSGPEGPIVSSRLEMGRRFLDSTPEILFSRYGLAEQEWTVVGVIGQLGTQKPPKVEGGIVNSDSSVNRAKVVDLVGGLLHEAAGLVDVPHGLGFSVIPLAVYRSLGRLSDAGSVPQDSKG